VDRPLRRARGRGEGISGQTSSARTRGRGGLSGIGGQTSSARRAARFGGARGGDKWTDLFRGRGGVYPAAGFVGMARRGGARTVECDVAEASASGSFGERRAGLATEEVPALVEEQLGSPG
jgi:hypothetical protein